jgi:hypothetical protein
MLPPMLLYLRIGTPERPGRGMWLPLFLVWLLLLPLAILAVLFTLLADVVLLIVGRPYHHYTLLLLRCLGLLGAMRGMVIRITTTENVVSMEFV